MFIFDKENNNLEVEYSQLVEIFRNYIDLSLLQLTYKMM